MPGGGAKRRLKRLKREGDESKQIVEQLMGLFMAHGVTVNFPYEIPNIVGQLLNGSGQGVPNHQQAIEGANASIDRLRQLTTGQPVQALPAAPAPPHQAPPVAPAPAANPAAPKVDPWAAAATGSAAPVAAAPVAPAAPVDPWGEAAAAPLAPAPAPAPTAPAAPAEGPPADGAPMSEAEMMARFQAGQERMVNRIATEGVQYKHGAQGPASGQRIAPAAGVQTGAAQPEASVPGAAPIPAPTGGGGGKRGMNGLTSEEARAIIARVTGQEVKPPGGNPVPKPPGM